MRRRLPVCLVRAILLALMVMAPAMAASVTSSLPAFYNPGVTMTVNLAVAPGAGVQVQAIEETPPTNWTVSAISHGGVFDTVTGKIKWGPFADAVARTLSFQITPPANAVGAKTFVGNAAFDSAAVSIIGVRSTAKFPGSLQRVIPSDYLPGTPVNIALSAAPAASVNAWAAEESVPNGWIVSAISESGEYDEANQKIKWGPFFDATARSLNYTITPPLATRAAAPFAAAVRFDEALLNDAATLPIRPSTLQRTVPATYRPLIEFEVTLTPAAPAYVQVIVLEESVPAGWTPATIAGQGTWDSANRKIKWGPLAVADLATTQFRYKLTPAANAVTALHLHATAIFDDVVVQSPATIERFLNNPANAVLRTLPLVYHPGQPVTVSLAAKPIHTALVYAYEESIPANWTVSNISVGGSFDAQNRRIKWGPFFDDVASPRTFTYQATPPADAFGGVAFTGHGNFDNQNVAATGDSELPNAPPAITRVLPARYNPGLPFTVTLNTAPVPGVFTHAIEEQVPLGWAVSAVSDGGAYDAINRKVKWGPFLDQDFRPLTYTVTPPLGARGTNSFSGEGLFNQVMIAVGGNVSIRQNLAPIPTAKTLNRPLNALYKVSFAALLVGATDADGDFLSVQSVSATSALGGAVEFAWPWIYYTAPVGAPAIDTFTYTITDGFGGTGAATVTLTPTVPPGSPAQNIIRLQPLAGGSVRVVFAGVPNFIYHIQYSADLNVWTPAVDLTANNVGQFEFLDEDVDSVPIRFYRSVWP
jgi:hypothetical protein